MSAQVQAQSQTQARGVCSCSFELNTWVTKGRGGPIYEQHCSGCRNEHWVALLQIAQRLLSGSVYTHATELPDHVRGFTPRYVGLAFELRRTRHGLRLQAWASGGAWWGEIDYLRLTCCPIDTAVVAGDWDWVAELLNDIAILMLMGDEALCSDIVTMYEIGPSDAWIRSYCRRGVDP